MHRARQILELMDFEEREGILFSPSEERLGELASLSEERKQRVESALLSHLHEWTYYSFEKEWNLLPFLNEHLPHIPLAEWPKRLTFGGMFINGRECLEDRVLIPPIRLQYYEPKFPFSETDSHFPAFDPDWIVFQDDACIALAKPKALPTVPAREQPRYNLKAYLEEYLQQKVHIASRLDTSTQGLIVVSIHPHYHDIFQKNFSDRTAIKKYLLVTDRQPPQDSWRCETPIGRHPHHSVLRCGDHTIGQSASTSFRTLEEKNGLFFIEATPHTGRTHQIRLHAALCGVPIVGDSFYEGTKGETLCLMSYALSFLHPKTTERTILSVPERLWPEWVQHF